MSSSAGATASQAWAILRSHARKVPSLRNLCRDDDRVSSLVTVVNSTDPKSGDHMLLVDLSRQRITVQTIHHLMRLATARKIREHVTQLAWGPNDPEHPMVPKRMRDDYYEGDSRQGTGNDHQKGHRLKRSTKQKSREDEAENDQNIPWVPSMHMAMRAPAGKGLEMLDEDGNNVLTAIHWEWERFQRISDSIRRGNLVGVTGNRIKDVVVVGRGVAVMALRFVYLALVKDPTANAARSLDTRQLQQRRIKFLTSVDPVRAAAVVADLHPASTVIINFALNGDEETNIAIQTLQSWILQHLGEGQKREAVLSKHVMLVTASKEAASKSKPESVFLIPEHSLCEPFVSFSAATLLPLSIVFGWDVVEQFLSGAHEMDNHFMDTNMRHNLPVLLALTDIWNTSCLESPGRMITPFTEAFAAYPAYCAALESQTCSHASDRISLSSYVVDGGLHGIYDGASYQSSHILPTELFTPMNTQIQTNVSPIIGAPGTQSVRASQDALMCSMFAHADEMAFGTDAKQRTLLAEDDFNSNANNPIDGNRPSTLVICDRCDAFLCGQLIALAEHRSFVKARLWGVDPFVKHVGTSVRSERASSLQEQLQALLKLGSDNAEIQGDDISFSTKSILEHYAGMVRGQRMHS